MPQEREALEALPGVGRKTANVVLNIAFGERDAGRRHARLPGGASARSGDRQDARSRLSWACCKVIPKAYLRHAHHWLILHGRYICQARKPQVRCLRRLRSVHFGRQVVRLRPAQTTQPKGRLRHERRQGREFLSIPGPTNVPDEVLAAMHRPAIDIYSGEMIGITDSCLADLAGIFRTKGRTYIYAANGHGGWEAALTNVLRRGDSVLVLESGRFARGWGEMAPCWASRWRC